MSLSIPTVLVAAAPTLQRQGLLATLRELRPDLTINTTSDTHTLVTRLRCEVPVLLIIDASLPGPPLASLLEQVREVQPQQRLLVLGGTRLPLSLRRHLVALGAGALLTPQATPEAVQTAIENLLLPPEESPLPPSAPGRASIPSLTPLSRRELDVLRLVMCDQDNAEIADHLCLSVRTVESHRRALLQKTGARTLTGLVVMAMREGWIELA
jgi:DNA-binding NarL/FixJ family response regulator